VDLAGAIAVRDGEKPAVEKISKALEAVRAA